MSESVAPCSSRVAMSIAFKRARRKFPKNFGLMSNAEEAYESSEHEDSPSKPNNEQEPRHVETRGIGSISDQLESSLVDSLDAVEISDKVEILCDHCEYYPENFESADQEVISPLTLEEKIEHNCDQRQSNHPNEFVIACEASAKNDRPNYAFHESNRSINLAWKEESDNCENMDSDVEGSRIYEIPQKFYERRSESTPSRRKANHKCKKSSTRSSTRHSCGSYFAPMNHACDDDGLLHSPDCPYYNHYCFHQRCHRFCCCRSCCCCSRSCSSCQDHMANSMHIHEPSTASCRRPSSHRKKRERCSTCQRRYSSPSKIPSTRRADTCSRDSGIFTSVRYENDDYDDGLSNNLEHKDSLCLLQNKYKMGSRKRGECSKREDKYSTKRPEQIDGASEEDDKETKKSSSRKFCRRLLNRCSNSY
ncbi:uncharacterized protein LOC100677800 isoform X2 [Nasonia vitripennis]|uniref:Uncharacterized protein n=1 Tax=Nasonia vitripennis TaxID=7425 RepID=A0A7M7H8I4_NASVI|nr:uncharacterized protein LOC100677800 isoform X2 [Nasonia vitripennis]